MSYKRFVLSVFLAFLLIFQVVASQDSSVGTTEKDGESILVDFPAKEFMPNIGSKIDGYGMCVDTSIEMSAVWAGLDDFRGFRDYWASKEGGGNYPQGVDRQVKAWCKLKNIPVPPYIQYQGNAPEEILSIADKTNRMACIAYGYSPRYGGQCINHMVNCVKFSGKYAAIMDNNLIGGNSREKLYEWMDLNELSRRLKLQAVSNFGTCGTTQAWVFIWLENGPPPKIKE